MSRKEIQGNGLSCSFEVFPPKTDVGMEALCGAGGELEKLYSLNPSAVCCTYDPGGANAGKNLMILDKIVRDERTTALTHFPCIGNTRDGILRQLQTYLDHGISHVLAFRGDLPQSRRAVTGEISDGAALTELIRREFGSRFTIAVAGAPEGRRSIGEEVESLRRKQDSGADYIITRLCWDTDRFCRWLEALHGADIRMPVVAGILPVLDQAETIQAALASNGGVMPPALAEMVSRNWIYPNPFVKDPFDGEAERKKAAFRAAGMAFTLGQIEGCRACGISGIHLHTRNRFEDAAQIAAAAGLI